ncbi:MAG: hypothetical protein AAB642_00275 [Patescibacteria group bacterium]
MSFDNKGISLLEIVLVIALLAIIMSAMAQLNLSAGQRVGSSLFDVRAKHLAAETLEALRILKEIDWANLSNLTADRAYYLSFSDISHRWSVVGADPGQIDGVFSRSFMLKPVRRDLATGRIVEAGGSLDSKTLLAEAVVEWPERGMAKNVKVSTYLAEFR